MFFNKEYLNNSAVAKQQQKIVELKRRQAYMNDMRHNRDMGEMARIEGLPVQQLKANEGFIPRDVYQDFDRDIQKESLTDRGMPFIQQLMPKAKSTGVGNLTVNYAQSSEVGVIQTSVSGQQGVLADAMEHKYDGFPVLVHDGATEVNWRQFASASAEGYDLLRENNLSVVRAMMEHFATTFLDGMVDKDGNYISIDGKTWKGARNDTHVEQVDLGAAGINFDFTDNTQAPADIKKAFIEVRDKLRKDNNYNGNLTFYISKEIESVFELRFSESYDSRTVQQELSSLAGIAGFVMTRKLSGNEMMALPEGDEVRPLVAMPVSTIILPRQLATDNYRAVTSSIVGWEAKNDFAGRKFMLYASEIS